MVQIVLPQQRVLVVLAAVQVKQQVDFKQVVRQLRVKEMLAVVMEPRAVLIMVLVQAAVLAQLVQMVQTPLVA